MEVIIPPSQIHIAKVKTSAGIDDAEQACFDGKMVVLVKKFNYEILINRWVGYTVKFVLTLN